jgi:1-deoxy-D-xylulose 5-phosphate reductoisomerase
LPFTRIAPLIEHAMDEFEPRAPDVGSLAEIRNLDRQARVRAAELVRFTS